MSCPAGFRELVPLTSFICGGVYSVLGPLSGALQMAEARESLVPLSFLMLFLGSFAFTLDLLKSVHSMVSDFERGTKCQLIVSRI